MIHVCGVVNTIFMWVKCFEYELGLNIGEWLLYRLIKIKLNGNVLCNVGCAIFHLKVKYVRKVRL